MLKASDVHHPIVQFQQFSTLCTYLHIARGPEVLVRASVGRKSRRISRRLSSFFGNAATPPAESPSECPGASFFSLTSSRTSYPTALSAVPAGWFRRSSTPKPSINSQIGSRIDRPFFLSLPPLFGLLLNYTTDCICTYELYIPTCHCYPALGCY